MAAAIDGSSTPAPVRPGRAHRKLGVAMIVVSAVLALLAINSLWINRQVLNTDNFTTSSAKLLQDDQIRGQLSGFLVDTLYANVDVSGEIQSALPPRLQPLAPAVASGLRNLAERAANELLQRPRVQQAWENANRAAHTLLLNVLYNKGNAVSTANGTVVLDLRTLLIDLAQRVGLSGNLVSKIPPDAANITILKSDQLKSAQGVAKLLRHLPWVLTLLTLALMAGAVALARGWRREALRAVGWALLIAGIGALLLRVLVENNVVNSLVKADSVRPAVRNTWNIETTQLIQASVAAVLYGLVIIGGTWLAGHTRPATAVRGRLAPFLRDPGTAYGGLLVILLLVAWWGPTPATRNFWLMLVLSALAAGGVAALRRQTAREFPDAGAPAVEPGGPAGEPAAPAAIKPEEKPKVSA